ncbi:cytosine-specific methyltransferase [Burkholderia sp. THE68]|uniref:DNA (cytosine-5-)-methyltransferase n=1 Tax=Burkholderia sp. THE68 TaxID=758782 RepID=UPI00131937D3|nr:DNA (cytosine-5-)-methyltransferase [Burkholderia sp. THE68]BBU30253.1 cytosine-specific methyltransferase [Burkholderia sp. THE68]
MSNQQNQNNSASKAAHKLNVAELFAGVGGFRLGLDRVHGQPYEVTLSNQFEPSKKAQHASDVYAARWTDKNHFNEDIFTFLASSRGQAALCEAAPDVLVAGFPCQDYSVAKPLSQSKGLAGRKGVLWWAIAQLLTQRLEAGQPTQYLILENVDRLLASPAACPGSDFATVLSTLCNLGYAAEWRVVNASEYGFPQKRRRVFIVAYHSSTNTYRAIKDALSNDGLAWHRDGILQSAFPNTLERPSDGANPAFAVTNEPLTTQIAYTPLSNGKSRFANNGLMLDGNVWTAKARTLAIDDYQAYTGNVEAMTLGDVVRKTVVVPESFYVSPKSAEKFKLAKGAKRIAREKNGFAYDFTEGAMNFPDRLDIPSRTIITSEGGTGASRTKHVIATPSGRLRRLLPEELEALNGFPRGFTEAPGVSDVSRAFLMGNALVVGLVTRIGEALHARHMRHES